MSLPVVQQVGCRPQQADVTGRTERRWEVERPGVCGGRPDGRDGERTVCVGDARVGVAVVDRERERRPVVVAGYVENLPFEDGAFDAVISNGVINLSSDKQRVFEEANRVLADGGRLAISDIISERQMSESIKTDADLWAACIGGAEQVDSYTTLVENAGFEMMDVRDNSQYEFISDQAANACQKYGVKSISLGARK